MTDISVNIQSNWVTIRPHTDRHVELIAIPRAVARAGYNPADMTLRAAGTFEQAEGSTLFRIRNWPDAYPIAGKPAPADLSLEQSIEAGVKYDLKRGALSLMVH